MKPVEVEVLIASDEKRNEKESETGWSWLLSMYIALDDYLHEEGLGQGTHQMSLVVSHRGKYINTIMSELLTKNRQWNKASLNADIKVEDKALGALPATLGS